MLELTALVSMALVAEPPKWFTVLPACASATVPIDSPCTLPSDFSGPAIGRLLGRREHLWWITGDRLSLVARPGAEDWAALCCAIQTPLKPITGSDLAGVTVRVPRMNDALLEIGTSDSKGKSATRIVRGPGAPPAPARVEHVGGQMTTVRIDSAATGETRTVQVYVPPGTPADARLPVIYLADGPNYAAMAEAAVRDGRAAPAILVGMPAAEGDAKGCRQVDACDRRMLEYLLDANPDGAQTDTPFARHLRFVTDELLPYIEKHFPVSSKRADRITAGYSNGGAWALAAAEARPDLFGGVLAMSSGSKAAAEYAGRLKDVRVYAGAGVFEPGFHKRTMQAVEVASAAGADAIGRTIVAGHSAAMWDILFADGYAWLLPGGSAGQR